jgi:hypothetical protein
MHTIHTVPYIHTYIHSFIHIGKDKLPSHLEDLKVMKDLQHYALQSNINNPEAYEEVKKGTNLT